jgi:hypothetical protein
LTAFSAGGCEVIDSVIVIVNIPTTVEIIQEGDTLIATSGNSYQWYLDGELIDNAVDSFFIPNATGNYSIEVIDENGCSSTSEVTFITVGTSDLNLRNWKPWKS